MMLAPTFRSARGVTALLLMIGQPDPVGAATSPSYRTHVYSDHVAQAAHRFGIPERWIWAVMRQESGGNAYARSAAGAQGLMQIMPGTWAMLTARFRLGSNAYDVGANIHAGAAYLRMMWNRYRSVPLMLAAYNAGPARADAYAAGRAGLPRETVNYVARIAASLGSSSTLVRAAIPSSAAHNWRSAVLFTDRKKDIASQSGAASAVPAALPLRAVIQTERHLVQERLDPLFAPISGSGQ